MDDKRFVTVVEMARQLNCSQNTIRRMIYKGDIPHMKMPGAYRMDLKEVVLALSQDLRKP